MKNPSLFIQAAEYGHLPSIQNFVYYDAIYVLHCFQKKTEKTSKADVELAAKRYRELLKEPGQ